MQLLKGLMIRHCKKEMAQLLAEPVHQPVVLRMSLSERMAYNTIVAYTRANLVLTTRTDGETSGWQDSLMNPVNRR